MNNRWPGERLHIALVHYPVYNKNGEVVTTSVTNLDIHDIARAARTFGIQHYFIVTPVPGQRELVEKISRHWQQGWGAQYNEKRKDALDIVKIADTLDEAVDAIAADKGKKPKIVVTSARPSGVPVSYSELSELLCCTDDHYLLVFGTGWGLTEEIHKRADYILAPIIGCGDYNHLSVRSAVSIILDRLLGR